MSHLVLQEFALDREATVDHVIRLYQRKCMINVDLLQKGMCDIIKSHGYNEFN